MKMSGRRNNRSNNNGIDLAATLVAVFQGLMDNHNQQHDNDHSRVIEQFHRYRPTTFNGRDGPVAMEEWITTIEWIFELLRCTDVEKILCATFLLKEDAGQWWDAYCRTKTEEERNNMTWADFKDAITHKYLAQSYLDENEEVDEAMGDMD
ncbi:hypothetical protein OROMI_034543 [Orobanche minor]